MKNKPDNSTIPDWDYPDPPPYFPDYKMPLPFTDQNYYTYKIVHGGTGMTESEAKEFKDLKEQVAALSNTIKYLHDSIVDINETFDKVKRIVNKLKSFLPKW
jgi:hypothetical protein